MFKFTNEKIGNIALSCLENYGSKAKDKLYLIIFYGIVFLITKIKNTASAKLGCCTRCWIYC